MERMSSGVAPALKNVLLHRVEPFNAEQAKYRMKLVEVALHHKVWCLVVVGGKGNGKSYMAQAAVNSFNADSPGGLYTTQPEIQAELWDDSRSNGAVYRKYTEAPLLVIDEISDRPKDWTEFVKTNVENILIERHRLSRPTVLIGNIDMKRVAAMFDARVRDRLREGLVMQMRGETLRRDADGK